MNQLLASIPTLAHAYSIACTLLATFFAARLLGLESFGTFAVWSTLALSVAGLAYDGLTRVLARRLPQRRHRGFDDIALVRAGMAAGSRLSIALCASALAVLALADAFDLVGDAVSAGTALLAIPFMAVTELAAAIAFARRRLVVAVMPGRVLRPSVFLAAVAWAWASDGNLLTVMIAFCASNVVSAIAAAPAALRGTLGRSRSGSRLRRGVLRYSTSFWIYSAIMTLRERSVLLLLGLVGTPEQLSLFSAANRIATGLHGFLTMNVSAFQSRFVTTEKRDATTIEPIYDAMLIQRIAVALPAALLVLLTPTLLPLLFGAEFQDAWGASALLMIGTCSAVYLSPLSGVLAMTDQQDWMRRPAAVTLIASIGLTLLLGSTHGAAGAAAAAVVPQLALNLLHFLRLRTYLRFRIISRRAALLTFVVVVGTAACSLSASRLIIPLIMTSP